MRIDKLRLVNYRCHRDVEVDFAPQFNVLVGSGGSGKTSVLDALTEAFSGLFDFTEGALRPGPLQDDTPTQERVEVGGRLRVERRYPVTIEASGTSGAQRFTWGFGRSSAGMSLTPSGAAPRIGPGPVSLAARNEKSPERTLPIVAFYCANRQWPRIAAERDSPAPQASTAAIQRPDRFDAYANYWDASADSLALQTWLISASLERFQVCAETGRRFDDIDDDELAVVNRALNPVIAGIKGVRYDVREKELLVERDGTSDKGPSFETLGNGQKSIVCLVTDIARRMCVLNPHLGSKVATSTPGVVLIDELDLHLHPAEQRAVALGLQTAFPLVQFIVASHSPQIIGEMRPEQLIVLGDGGASRPRVSYGLDSSSILEEIMGTPARPTSVKTALNAIFASLERNELSVARQLIAELKQNAPGIPDIVRAEALLMRKEVVGR